MSLAVAFNQARQTLQTVNSQIALSGRNVAGAGDPDNSRAMADIVTSRENGALIVRIDRAENAALYARMIAAGATAAEEQAIADGLAKLARVVGDPADGASPAARIGALQTALSDFANTPTEIILGETVLAEADAVAKTLNEASEAVRLVRQEADAGIADAVARVNDILSRFETLNDAIVTGTNLGRDVTTLLDERDGLVRSLSEEIGVVTRMRGNNDMVLFTDSGATLFETSARTVSFVPQNFAAGTVGNQIFVDNVAVAGPGAAMPVESGRIRGLATLRDDIALTFERQLDETARGLIEAFREADQVAAGPDLAGLFTDAGSPTVPPGFAAGLAGRIAVNAAVDPRAGGDIRLLRDGGINGADYVYNPGGVGGFAGYADRLRGLADAIAAPFAADPVAGLPPGDGVDVFAASSAGWLEERRSGAVGEAEYARTLSERAKAQLSNAVGVNMDDEYAFQLELERSFAASSRLISLVDDLFQTLFRDLQ